MTLDEAIKRYIDNAEYERTHGSLHGCLEFKQLAEWLKDYKRLKEQEPILDNIRAEIEQIPSELTADGRRMIRRGSVFRIIDKYNRK